jgi:UDP-N-acetylmuramoylalanine--D-glutamate ligase
LSNQRHVRSRSNQPAFNSGLDANGSSSARLSQAGTQDAKPRPQLSRLYSQNSKLKDRFSGKSVLILGLAREGESLARFLAREGAQVTVTDSAPAEQLADRVHRLQDGLRAPGSLRLVLGADHPELADSVEAFFVSPGVPENSPVYRAATAAGLQPQSMTTLFFELCPGQIVGVTGSSGKTTTAGLIGHVLATARRDVVVGGNIGDPMLDLLPQISAQTVVVLELSSFQLSILRRSPRIAVVTNITPNHLDRHSTMAEYVAAKRHIVDHQLPADFAVLNAGDNDVAQFARTTSAEIRWFGESIEESGACIRDGLLTLRSESGERAVMPVSDVPLRGRHNVENVLASLATAAILDVEMVEMAAGVRTYCPPAHRLQTVGDHDGVLYVDDSIATSPARASVALNAFDAPILLIAGGRDKRLPWEEFARLVAEKTIALFLMGEAAPHIESAVLEHVSASGSLRSDAIRRCDSLADAVDSASKVARPGDVVLLAPACTSFDMFTDYEERGVAFAHAVEALNAA